MVNLWPQRVADKFYALTCRVCFLDSIDTGPGLDPLAVGAAGFDIIDRLADLALAMRVQKQIEDAASFAVAQQQGGPVSPLKGRLAQMFDDVSAAHAEKLYRRCPDYFCRWLIRFG